ncbi:MAG: flagellar hook assembly protein FlgD [OCS116 cluster bacterium]|uniref:Basal-body rod modification protein FlgD n=1 Tax=OCS116 cluster bacterium TaxID=2030921 RepID=A0A2A4YPT3_9PROT|nr:flagellar hook assembly protein FlgD [OCS116 cluster bacterium]
MTIASVSAELSAQNAGNTAVKQKTIADNFDIFLKLLTTQLKNQNPLEPLKTSEFTQQMVQFTQVEQQVKANTNLEELARLFSQQTMTSSVGYIGKTVTAEGSTTNLQNDKATWDVEFDQAPADSSIIISNSAGRVVYATKTDFRIGNNNFTWDGKDNSGQSLPNGLYTIKVNATNDSEEALTPNTMVSGVVTGVDMTGSSSVLNLGDRSVKLENVRKIEA